MPLFRWFPIRMRDEVGALDARVRFRFSLQMYVPIQNG
jgi:hypothetical protein